MFKIGDKVACPMPGAGVVSEIKSIESQGEERDYFVISLLCAGMKIMVPVDGSQTGIRLIITKNEAEALIGSFALLKIDDISLNWSKRYRENVDRIKTGDVQEIAKVLKCLMVRSTGSNLSAGERKMLQNAKSILTSELGLALDLPQKEVEDRLVTLIATA